MNDGIILIFDFLALNLVLIFVYIIAGFDNRSVLIFTKHTSRYRRYEI